MFKSSPVRRGRCRGSRRRTYGWQDVKAAMATKRKMVECIHCTRVFSTASDVAQDAPGGDKGHLYIMTSTALPGLCKVGRSHDPQARAAELHEAMPFFLQIYSVFWAKGHEERRAHEALALFKLHGVPGQEWFQIEAKDACAAVARALG